VRQSPRKQGEAVVWIVPDCVSWAPCAETNAPDRTILGYPVKPGQGVHVTRIQPVFLRMDLTDFGTPNVFFALHFKEEDDHLHCVLYEDYR
jgi:hypothetical protein